MLRGKGRWKHLPGGDPHGAVDPDRDGRSPALAGRSAVHQAIRARRCHELDGRLQGRRVARGRLQVPGPDADDFVVGSGGSIHHAGHHAGRHAGPVSWWTMQGDNTPGRETIGSRRTGMEGS